MTQAERFEKDTEEDVSVHIFNTSAQLIGVCLAVIGILAVVDKLKLINTFADELLALDAIAFLTSCILSYLALRARKKARRFDLERAADYVFLSALVLMAIVCTLVTSMFLR